MPLGPPGSKKSGRLGAIIAIPSSQSAPMGEARARPGTAASGRRRSGLWGSSGRPPGPVSGGAPRRCVFKAGPGPGTTKSRPGRSDRRIGAQPRALGVRGRPPGPVDGVRFDRRFKAGPRPRRRGASPEAQGRRGTAQGAPDRGVGAQASGRRPKLPSARPLGAPAASLDRPEPRRAAPPAPRAPRAPRPAQNLTDGRRRSLSHGPADERGRGRGLRRES